MIGKSQTIKNALINLRTLILAVLILVCLGVRLARIDSDSPPLPNKFRNVAPYKDEGAKAHEARNRALFGQWQANPMDNYRFWSVQSPVWTWTLFLWFKAMGVSYASMRLLSILCALAAVLAGVFTLRRADRETGALAFPVIFGLNFYFLIFSRLGLMESMLIAWAALFLAFITEALRKPLYFLPATVSLLAAVFTKQTALLLLPLWAAFILWLALKKSVKPSGGVDFRAVGMLATSALVLLAPIVLKNISPDFRDVTSLTVHHGFHLTSGVVGDSIVERLEIILSSFSADNLWRGFFMMLPSASILGLGWIVHVAWRLVTKRPVTGLELMLVSWFAFGRLAAVATPHQVVRFHLFYFFPLSMMAAMAVDRLWQPPDEGATWRGRKLAARLLVIVLLCYELFMTAVPWAKWVSEPRYDIVHASRRLGKILAEEREKTGRGPVLIGEWVGPLSLENDMVCYYVKGPFNNDPRRLAAFGVTHLLESTTRHDPAVGRFKKLFPQAYEERVLVAEIPVRLRHLKLWRITPVSATNRR